MTATNRPRPQRSHPDENRIDPAQGPPRTLATGPTHGTDATTAQGPPVTQHEPPQVGVIGAGPWGQRIAACLAELGALAAIADPNPTRRDECQRRFPALPLFAHHDPLLRSPITAAVIATPMTTHATIARHCLDAGKDLFIEKPFTTNTRAAQTLARQATRSERILMVGHLLLYQSGIQWIHTRLAARPPKQPIHTLHQRHSDLTLPKECALWGLAVHDVAVAIYIHGATPTLSAATIALDDAGLATDVRACLHFPNSSTANIHAAWNAPERRRCLTVQAGAHHWTYDELTHEGREIGPAHPPTSPLVHRDAPPLLNEMRAFLDHLNHRSLPLSNQHLGLAVVQVLQHIARHATLLTPTARANQRLWSAPPPPRSLSCDPTSAR